MKEHKIGIITFHAAENFGSALQAFALQNILKKWAYESEIIDFILESDMQQYQIFRIGFYKNNPKAFLADLIYYKRNRKRKLQFAQFREEYLKMSKNQYYAGKSNLEELNEIYDIFICGSDQIWNLNCTGRLVPEFFLSFAFDTKRKIAYAPSMPQEVSEEYYEDLRRYIERLDFVSVRERETVGYLEDKVNVQADIIHACDPTLLLDTEEYTTMFHLEKSAKQYIFVYILDVIHFDRKLIAKAKSLAKSKKLGIKYVSSRHFKELITAEYCLGMGPIEFLESIYNASYVITDSFHATVFSIQFHVPFCVFPRKGSESRMVGLLDMLGLKDNLYFQDNMTWVDSKSDESTINKLKALSQNSLEFLLTSLE